MNDSTKELDDTWKCQFQKNRGFQFVTLRTC